MDTKSLLTAVPPELVEKVLWECTVEDTQNLMESVAAEEALEGNPGEKERAIEECKRRLNPRAYLVRNLGTGANEILNAMLECGVTLSGSRALEFFVPGCVADDSDWDFYCNFHPLYARRFMEMTSFARVRWPNPVRDMERIVNAGTGHTVMSAWELRNMVKTLEDWPSPRFMAEKKVAYFEAFEAPELKTFPVRMTMSEGVLRASLERGEETDESYDAMKMSILKGYLTVRDVDYSINLMVSSDDVGNHLSYLLSFHSSCVQCYIGPFDSCHLYGKLASKKQSYHWELYDTNTHEGKRKYTARGFEYVSLHPVVVGKSRRLRSGDDEEVTRCEGYGRAKYPERPEEFAPSMFSSLAWWEHEGRTNVLKEIFIPTFPQEADTALLWTAPFS